MPTKQKHRTHDIPQLRPWRQLRILTKSLSYSFHMQSMKMPSKHCKRSKKVKLSNSQAQVQSALEWTSMCKSLPSASVESLTYQCKLGFFLQLLKLSSAKGASWVLRVRALILLAPNQYALTLISLAPNQHALEHSLCCQECSLFSIIPPTTSHFEHDYFILPQTIESVKIGGGYGQPLNGLNFKVWMCC